MKTDRKTTSPIIAFVLLSIVHLFSKFIVLFFDIVSFDGIERAFIQTQSALYAIIGDYVLCVVFDYCFFRAYFYTGSAFNTISGYNKAHNTLDLHDFFLFIIDNFVYLLSKFISNFLNFIQTIFGIILRDDTVFFEFFDIIIGSSSNISN